MVTGFRISGTRLLFVSSFSSSWLGDAASMHLAVPFLFFPHRYSWYWVKQIVINIPIKVVTVAHKLSIDFADLRVAVHADGPELGQLLLRPPPDQRR